MKAQVLEEGEPSMVYYSPKTAVNLEFTYVVETQEPGIYAAYAEQCLGIANVIREPETSYALQEVKIHTSTSTDYNRPHAVNILQFPAQLTLNEKGVLTGYNAAEESARPCKKREPHQCGQPACDKADPEYLIPLPEEVLKAPRPQMQAATLAKQIFHLRETRMYLLTGEVEHAPADGKAMELVLAELDRQEQAMLAFFVGKKTRRTETYRTQIQLTEKAALDSTRLQTITYYFSEENGFTGADNIDANAIIVNVAATPQTLRPHIVLDEKAEKKIKPIEWSPIVYNLPGTGEVSVMYQGAELANRTIEVAQYGVDVALPMNLFTGKTLPKIVFCEKTGNIVSIAK